MKNVFKKSKLIETRGSFFAKNAGARAITIVAGGGLIMFSLFKMKNTLKKSKAKLLETRGSFFTEHAMVIAITCAVGGLVILFLFGLFEDTIFVELTNSVKNFFAFS